MLARFKFMNKDFFLNPLDKLILINFFGTVQNDVINSLK